MKITVQNYIKCGFFPENIPQKLFLTKEFTKYFLKKPKLYINLENDIKSAGITSTPCSLLSCYKDENERRIMAFPHIETYLLLAKECENNKKLIHNKIKNNIHSYSNIIKPFEIDGYKVRSSFHKNYLDRTKFSLGYKYMLHVDLSKCYENIYTHSITWALLSKDKAKQEYIKSKSKQSLDHKQADKLDTRVRCINNNETKGIPTGPLTSRLISEIILSEIDREIETITINFKRYVDDYNFYFKSKTDAETFIPKLQRVLYEYKLHLNSQKTEIQRYPYSIRHNLKNELGNFDFKNLGCLNFIERFNELFLLGNKGAMKYGLKKLSKISIPISEKEVVFSHLINLLVSFPNLAPHIYSICLNNTFTYDSNTTRILNDLLLINIKSGFHIEVIWLLTFMLTFNVTITNYNLVSVINEMEVFSTILALDYVFAKKLTKQVDIKVALVALKKNLKSVSIYGDKWLLVYEANRNKWVPGIKAVLNKSKLLKEAYDNDIKFYHSPL